MLYLTRKIGEKIVINNNIEIEVVEVKAKSVKLGFNFPSDNSVLRKEIYDLIKEENLSAASDLENKEQFNFDFKDIKLTKQD